MTIYTASVYVGSYEIEAFCDSPEKVIKVLVSTYRKNFGSFTENGFKNQADWLEYHGIDRDSVRVIKLNTAEVR